MGEEGWGREVGWFVWDQGGFWAIVGLYVLKPEKSQANQELVTLVGEKVCIGKIT